MENNIEEQKRFTSRYSLLTRALSFWFLELKIQLMAKIDSNIGNIRTWKYLPKVNISIPQFHEFDAENATIITTETKKNRAYMTAQMYKYKRTVYNNRISRWKDYPFSCLGRGGKKVEKLDRSRFPSACRNHAILKFLICIEKWIGIGQ